PYMYSLFDAAMAPPLALSLIISSWPPYLPGFTQRCGITYGFSGSRSSTGGSSPFSTSSFSIGASWKDAGLGKGLVSDPFWDGSLVALPLSPPCPEEPVWLFALLEQAPSMTAPAAAAEV